MIAPSKIEWLVTICLVVFIIIFHIIVLTSAGSLWRDEANSAQLAMEPLSQGLNNALHYDSFPPGGTIFFHLWSYIQSSDFGFRIAGFLIGTAIILALFLNNRLFGFGLPLVSLTFLELNRNFIWYGDSIRPYGLGTLFIIITIGLLWKICSDQPNYKVIIAGAITSILAVQVLYQNSFLLLAGCLAGMAVCAMHREWKKVFLIFSMGALAALTLVPYIGYIKFAHGWSTVAYAATDYYSVLSVFQAALGVIGQFLILIGIELLFFGILLFYFLSFKKSISDRVKDLFLFSAILSITATTGFIIFIKNTHVATRSWYFLPLMAILAISLEALFFTVLSKISFLKSLRALVALIALVISIQGLVRGLNVRATNIDEVSTQLTTKADKEDLILINPWFIGVSFNRAYHGPTKWQTMPPLSDNTIHRYDLLKDQLVNENNEKQTIVSVEKTLNAGNKVWVVGNIGLLEDYLTIHSTESKKLDTENGQVINGYENVQLTEFSGWKP